MELPELYLGASTMNKLQKQFEKSCKRSFQFLMEEYSCQIISCGKHAAGMAITYANSTTGVKVNFEPRENLIFVYLIQLRDGKIPAYLESVEPDSYRFFAIVSTPGKQSIASLLSISPFAELFHRKKSHIKSHRDFALSSK